MKTRQDLDKQTSVLQGSVDELYQKHNELQSFHDAREWDNDSRAIIELLQNFKNDWIIYRKDQENILEQLVKDRNNKSFINRVLSKTSTEDETKKNIKQTEVEINSIDKVIDELNEMMDKTPANKSEQKEIAEAIKELKKNLILQKREINENLRQTRANARTKTANWSGATSGMLRTVARYKRTSIRMEKEQALVPMENLKAFTEEKLIALEKDLNWVMHFRGNEQDDKNQVSQAEKIIENVLRCKYCGRRVSTSNDTCLGCGAII